MKFCDACILKFYNSKILDFDRYHLRPGTIGRYRAGGKNLNTVYSIIILPFVVGMPIPGVTPLVLTIRTAKSKFRPTAEISAQSLTKARASEHARATRSIEVCSSC